MPGPSSVRWEGRISWALRTISASQPNAGGLFAPRANSTGSECLAWEVVVLRGGSNFVYTEEASLMDLLAARNGRMEHRIPLHSASDWVFGRSTSQKSTDS